MRAVPGASGVGGGNGGGAVRLDITDRGIQIDTGAHLAFGPDVDGGAVRVGDVVIGACRVGSPAGKNALFLLGSDGLGLHGLLFRHLIQFVGDGVRGIDLVLFGVIEGGVARTCRIGVRVRVVGICRGLRGRSGLRGPGGGVVGPGSTGAALVGGVRSRHRWTGQTDPQRHS